MTSAALIEHPEPGFFARLLLGLIRVYQLTLSKMIGPVCRFEPSCSRYSAACISSHGALRGSLLSVRRLCKCHPFHPGGFDPPPPPPNADRRDRA
ncbi:MAG TPA: membrane protein insertion efficiency factor YidD [Polyangiaceae bacterium]